ncbi:MAG TPA: ABC transporter permease [Candidatus Angelobacter sp.]
MNSLLLEVRQAVRAMKKSPAFTLLAMVMLAVGIGATTAIFSVFYSVLLQPLPFPEPERLVQLWETRLQNHWDRVSFTEGNFWDVRARNRSFEEVAAYHDLTVNMTGAGDPEQTAAGMISAGFFRVLGTKPVLGRDFLPVEDQPGHQNQVLLLRNKFWRSHFGADPHVIGKTVRLNDKVFEIVGVLPPGEPWLDAADLFIPLVQDAKADHGSFEFAVIGRLRKGVSKQAALADLQPICKGLAEQYPKDDAGMGITLQPSSEWLAGRDLRTKLWVLMGAVGFLLVIACMNLANLLLAKATGRTREIAARVALGATRARIVRMILTESLVLGLSGALFGVFLAMLAISAIQAASPSDIPRIDQISINPWVLAFTLATALTTGSLSGLVPALQAPYKNIVASLREGERSQMGGRGQRRWRAALVTAEIALSLMLLVGAGLLLRSFDRLLRVDRGFQTEHRLVATVNMPDSYKPERVDDIAARFIARATSVPGVLSVATTNSRPILGWNPGMGIVSAKNPNPGSGNFPWADWRVISRDYFRTMGIPVLRGRTFNEHDLIGKPWRIIISQRLADRLWPGEDPVGQQALLWKGQSDFPAEVIGVVGNQRERGLDSNPTLTVYLSAYGYGPHPTEFVVHSAGTATSVVPALRSILKEVDPSLPMADVQTLDQVVAKSVAPRRFNMLLLTIFAAVALLLAMIGVYGVLAYAVAGRTAEIGLRVALGAGPRSVLALIIGQGMRPILAGIAIGLLGALGLSRFIAGLLYGVKPMDPLTYIAVAVIVGLTALLASYLPARRALRVDPVTALRQE